MRRTLVVLAGAMSLVLGGCGAEAEKGAAEGAPGAASEEVGVSTSELTNCRRTELANVQVECGIEYAVCRFRLMENNFACDEGVVGQASTEPLQGNAVTLTTVATLLFGESFEGKNGYAPVTIATQWGHAYASTHETWCRLGGREYLATWTLDPWTRTARHVPIPRDSGLPECVVIR